MLLSINCRFVSLQVRLGQVMEGGKVDTKKLGRHRGRVYKIAVEPGSPHIFYSCGEDGFVQHVCQLYLMKLVLPLFVYITFGITVSFHFPV